MAKLTYDHYEKNRNIHDEDAIKKTNDRDKYLLYSCGGGILLCVKLFDKFSNYPEINRNIFIVLGLLIAAGALAILNQTLSISISRKFSNNWDDYYELHKEETISTINAQDTENLYKNKWLTAEYYNSFIILFLMFSIVIFSLKLVVSLNIKENVIGEKTTVEKQKNEKVLYFKGLNLVFEKGQDELSEESKIILNETFPKYLKSIILNNGLKNIEEIIIEGHTSSEWNRNTKKEVSYLANMKLSEERSRNVLEYIIKMPESRLFQDELEKKLRIKGFSSAKIISKNGIEDKKNSRRIVLKTIMSKKD